jgi:glutamyl-tRNA reductase
MEILIVGLSHKTAPLDIRETISFSDKNMDEGVRALVSSPSVSEGLIISTCNRVEVYSAVSKKKVQDARDEIVQFLADFHKVQREKLDPHIYTMTGEECVSHIFRVASSLDSMVVGEPQILGQVKDAFGCAANARATGNILNRLLHKAFSVAKRVRSETRIATSAVSISFAAVELAKKIFGELEGKTVMLVGAGEMAELAARHLLNNGIEHIIVANRTYENAVKLAEDFKGAAVPFDELAQQMELADIVISSTGAPNVIIDKTMVKEVIKRRRNKPMFFIDIAVPRDIDPKVNEVQNVYAYDIDDLQGVVEANIKARSKEAAKAEEIVGGEIKQFTDWMRSRESFPTIVALRDWAEDIRKSELEKTLKRMNGLTEMDTKRIEAMSEAILNKILHRPISRMKNAAHEGDEGKVAEMVRDIFEIED